MAVFLMSTVNPSGLAIACSALFVAGILSAHAGRSRGRRLSRRSPAGCLRPRAGASRRDRLARHRFRRPRPIAANTSARAISVSLSQRPVGRRCRRRNPRLCHRQMGGTDRRGVPRPALGRWRHRPVGSGAVRAGLRLPVVGTFGWLDSPIGEETFLLAMRRVGVGGVDRIVWTWGVVGCLHQPRDRSADPFTSGVRDGLVPVLPGPLSTPGLGVPAAGRLGIRGRDGHRPTHDGACFRPGARSLGGRASRGVCAEPTAVRWWAGAEAGAS